MDRIDEVNETITQIYSGWSEIYNNITDENKSKIGFCIDTCHGFSAGYDFCDKNQVVQFFNYFDEKIGFENLCITSQSGKNYIMKDFFPRQQTSLFLPKL